VIAVFSQVYVQGFVGLRTTTNEASAVDCMRTMVSAQSMYYQGDLSPNETYDYAESLEDLYKYQLVDAFLGGGSKQGYDFVVYCEAKDRWAGRAVPSSPLAGEQQYYVDQEGRVFPTICGNGVMEKGEQCDPGDVETLSSCGNNGVCSAICVCEPFEQGSEQATSALVLRSSRLSELGAYAAQLVDELLGLAPGITVEQAITMVSSRQTPRRIFHLLDSDRDNMLSFVEMVSQDLTAVAKKVAVGWHIEGAKVDLDEQYVRHLVAAYQQALGDAMEIDDEGRERLPLISSTCHRMEAAIAFLRLFPAADSTP
jgi:hypothetical protein